MKALAPRRALRMEVLMRDFVSRFIMGTAISCLVIGFASCGGSSSVPSLPSPQNVVGRLDTSNNGVIVTPTSLAFTPTGSANAQTFVASTQFEGDISAVSSNTAIATVNPASAQAVKDPNDSRKSVTFTVTPLAPGTCTITVTDKKGNTATVTITVLPLFPNLNGPTGITFNSTNNYLYVANFNVANPVTVYDEHGNQIHPSGAFPNANQPLGLAAAAGQIYVASLVPPQNTQFHITVYDSNGNQVTTSGAFPGFLSPNSIAFDPTNNYLYVINYNAGATGHVNVYDLNGNPIPVPSGSFPGGSNIQGGSVFDTFNNRLYVANGPAPIISVYDPVGNAVPTSGSFPGLSGPTGVAFDPVNDHLYIGNVTNTNSILVFDGDGNPIATSGNFPNLSQPQALVFDPHNNYLYVCNYASNSIKVYDQNGNQIVAP